LLPSCELGFASTVHKAQGSECDEVLILLPEPGNALLARETLYTAVTRARKAVRVFGSEAAIRQAVERRMRRYGGLREIMKREE
jgi:exodeoxyribonuclease V alpha subunit